MSSTENAHDHFTADEVARLAPFVTNTTGPVFVVRNLPEVVKGALFARYSRSSKSLRRLLLDEFLDAADAAEDSTAGQKRGEELYDRIFVEYGDDSVAQLGAVHIACEGASNVLTKVIEWGRLASYLEQSTRYVPYTSRPNGRWKYCIPPELDAHPDLKGRYVAVLDSAFETYARWISPLEQHYARQFPPPPGTSAQAFKNSIRAKALDTLRGLLPAATQSNVGVFASGQALEMMLLRMRVAPEAEIRHYADLILTELRKVIPSFMRRVDVPSRGGRWSEYLAETRAAIAVVAERVARTTNGGSTDAEVVLSDYDPDGEKKVVAAALYACSTLSDRELEACVERISESERAEVLRTYAGNRSNRRHKPGRAFERTRYRFDILSDYGAFRDMQRHRLLTIEWQALSPDHGYVVSAAVDEVGAGDDWTRVMDASRSLHDAICRAGLSSVAQYAVCMAFRIRYYMEMNAREAIHVIELRSAPQGHPAYRRIAQEMHRLIAEVAGHDAIAAAMTFVNHEEVALERIAAEQAAESRRVLHATGI